MDKLAIIRKAERLGGSERRESLEHVIIAARDLGCESQIGGGQAGGINIRYGSIGYALMEELQVEDGRVTTVSFGDYKVPTIKDIPELRTILLESDSGSGPYNTKGIGENPIGPVAPAIANAVYDAVGVRIQDLPITAEKVLFRGDQSS